jgi:hypothetical protein
MLDLTALPFTFWVAMVFWQIRPIQRHKGDLDRFKRLRSAVHFGIERGRGIFIELYQFLDFYG